MIEEWRKVVGWSGYEVSSFGNVRSVDRVVDTIRGPRRYKGKILKPGPSSSQGHLTVSIGKDNSQLVHVLVAAAFIGSRPEGKQVCHSDGDPSNNNLSNLRYDTPTGNSLDRVQHGTQFYRTHCPRGHAYDAENTYIAPSYLAKGKYQRECRACIKIRYRAKVDKAKLNLLSLE